MASLLEAIAVVMAVAYLLLAIRQNILCWVAAGISTALYVYLFVDAKLYMESLLNGFYFGMAVYGWLVWHRGTQGAPLPVTVWPLSVHALAIAFILGSSLISGTVLARFTDASYPYIDSMTTWGAIWATFLVARKVLENWWYWLIIDATSVAIYWLRGLELTSLLFVAYVLLVPIGWLSWSRSMRGAAHAA